MVTVLMASDELVLVSGLPPLRARKLRYYEDSNFTARVADAPTLSEDGYRDRPAPRRDDWTGQVRGTDARLAAAADRELGLAEEDDEGGLQHQRHPGMLEPEVSKPVEPARQTDLDLLDDEADAPAQTKTMDRARRLSAVTRAYGIDGDPGRRDDDLLPGF